MFKVNALGDACPMPVIKTKKALAEHKVVEVQVDNDIAVQNITKMATQLKCDYTVTENSKTDFLVTIQKTAESAILTEEKTMSDTKSSDYIVVVNVNEMGRGGEEIGKKLIKGFLYSLTEQEVTPRKVIFYNSGVLLTTNDSESVNDLKVLQDKGCEIIICGACVDYFGIKEKVEIGVIGNMYTIVETMRSYDRVVMP